MKRRSILALLTTVIIASAIASGIAISGTVYTWEKIFEVKKPGVECKIKIGDCRVVGCPVSVMVLLKLDGCGDCCKLECDANLKCHCDDYYGDCWKCSCHVNGTYSAHLYWWNGTAEDWQHVKHLQEEMNISISCWWQIHKYTFTPEWEGKYKVAAIFAMDSETFTFTSED